MVMNKCANIISIAVGYYKRPAPFGGGGNSFTNWTISPQLRSTTNENYTAVVYRDSVIITGTGTEVVNENNSIKIQTVVTKKKIYSKVIN